MAITYNAFGANLSHIYQDDGGVFGANQVAAAVFDYFPDLSAPNDALYFGGHGTGVADFAVAWHNLQFDVGVAFNAAAVTFVWEYWNGAWTLLTGLVDGTAGFTNIGVNMLTFDRPEDWQHTTVNGAREFWVRCRIAAVVAPIEGGAQAVQAVQAGNNTILVTGLNNDYADIYAADAGGNWGVFKRDILQIFRCYASLAIGDSILATSLVEQNTALTLYGKLLVRNAATFQLGTLTADSVGIHGSSLIFFQYWFISHLFITDVGSEVIFNGSMVLAADGHQRGRYQFKGGLTVYDTNFMGHFYLVVDGAYTMVRSKLMTEHFEGPVLVGPAVLFDGTFCFPYVLTSNPVGLVLRNLNTPRLICNGALTAPISIIAINPTVTTYSYNRFGGGVNFDSFIYVDYDFDLRVVDSIGVGIPNVTVDIHDVFGALVFSGLTNGAGDIASQVLRGEEHHKPPFLPEVVTPETPHTVTMTAAGYITHDIIYTMDQARVEVEELETVVAPVADFVGFPLSGLVGLTVQFCNLSIGTSPLTYSWDFGDGSALSALENPQHTYVAAGTYDVSLTVTNAAGVDVEIKLAYVAARLALPAYPVYGPSQQCARFDPSANHAEFGASQNRAEHEDSATEAAYQQSHQHAHYEPNFQCVEYEPSQTHAEYVPA